MRHPKGHGMHLNRFGLKYFSKGTDFDQFGLKWVCSTYRPEIRHKRVLS